jgi:hypothetical protein
MLSNIRFMFNRILRGVAVLACIAGSGAAHAVDVDFDALIIRVDTYLERTSTNTTRLRDRDNDANGIKEPDQLGMLAEILAGGPNVDCIDVLKRTALTTAYTTNLAQVPLEMVISLPQPVGTRNLINALNDNDPGLGDALQKLLAGYMTIADSSTITFVNTLTDQLIAGYLKGTNFENETTNVQNQITFTGADFLCHGGAAGEPDYIGPRADIDGDGLTNIQEYADGAVVKTREEWLIANCITPTLRLVSFTGGGLRISGLKEVFRVETAGAAGPVTYQWRKGTTVSSTIVGNQQELELPFITSASSGTYFCTVSDGVTTRTTPLATLAVTNVPIFFATQPVGATRNPGSTHTFTVQVQGGNPGPYTYQWRRGNTVVGTNSPTLTLTNLTTADAGSYRCTVTSNGGGDSITSSAANLNVRQINFSLSSQPQGAKKYVGQSHTLSVSVTGGSGSFLYVWKRNGSSFGAPNTASITLNNLQLNDAGSYTCTVTDVLNTSNNAETDAAVVEVAQPLQITTHPVGGLVQIGGLIILTVEATGGFAPLSYQWRWQGVPITGQTTNVYTNVALSGFEGAFSCRITDANGSFVISESADITLAPEIFITKQPLSAKKYVGQSHTLSITASGGSAPLAYQWYKNNVNLGSAAQSNALSFSSLSLGDDGTYFCRVTDALDSVKDSEPVEVRVANQPTFGQQPQDQEITAGGTLTLSVTVNGGIPPLTYQWRKDVNTPLLGGTSNVYTKSNVTTADTGIYHCRVTDGNGTVINSLPAVVNVASVVQVTQQPQGGAILAGEDFTFAIAIQGGVGTITYEWLKDGNKLNVPSLPTLTIMGATEADSGAYQARITDGNGVPVYTEAAQLYVAGPLRIDAHPQGGNFIEGDTVQLSVTPGGGLPPYSYQWLVASIALPGKTAQTLSIPGAALLDTGLYSVRVRDALDQEIVSEIAPVLVAPKITITMHPTGVDRYTGGSHTFRVAATGGNGEYTYIWRRNGDVLPDAPNAPELTLENMQPEQSGFYDCVITETQGGAAASFPAYARIRDPLTPVSQPENAILTQGSSHTLRFETAGGFEPVGYQWVKDDELLLDQTGNELVIESATVEDEGFYKCIAFDTVSSIIASDEVMVSVVKPIALLVHPEGATRAPGEDHTFTVQATGGGGLLHYAWYRDDEQLDVPDAPALVIEDLETIDQGVYYCIVFDEAGSELQSEEALLVVSAQPIDIAKHPESGERYPGESFTLSATASGGVGVLQYQWRRNTGNGYEDIEGANSPTLEIASVSEADAGQYRCRISDESEQLLQTFAATLKVTPRLSVVTPPAPVEAYVGASVSFTVEVSGGIGQTFYVWFKDGKAIGGNSATLTLENVSDDDAGSYHCMVSATRDNISTAPAELAVGQPLDILTEPATVSRYVGEMLEFGVEVQGGVGKLHYAWYKDDTLVRTAPTLVIGKLTEEDEGGYSVVVSDSISAAIGEVILTLDVVPVEGELPPPQHSADANNDGILDLSEVLGIIQLYNAGAYHCDNSQPGGFGAGENLDAPTDCAFHSSDYGPPYRVISLSELLRALQFFQLGYWYCPSEDTEDSYCAGSVPMEGEDRE